MVDRYDHELILGYVEGELSPEDQARFEAVLGGDPALRQLVCDLQADRRAVRQMADEDPPADLVEGVIQRLERQMLLSEPAGAMPTEFRRPEARRLRFRRALGYCAIAAVLLISGALVFLPLTRPSLLDEVRRHDTPPPKFSGAEAEPTDNIAQVPQTPLAADAAAAREPAHIKPQPDQSLALALGQSRRQALPADERAEADLPTSVGSALDAMESPSIESKPAGLTAETALAMKEMALGAGPAPMPGETRVGRTFADARIGPTKSAQAVAAATRGAAESPMVDGRRGMPPPQAQVDSPAPPLTDQRRIEVSTDSAGETRRALMAWAPLNRANIVTPTHGKLPGNEKPRRGDAFENLAAQSRITQPTEESNETAQQIIVQLDDDQVVQLLDYLNTSRRGRQQARLIEPATVAGRHVPASDRDRVQRQLAPAAAEGPAAAGQRSRSAGAFHWGRGLEAQLPLAPLTPIAAPRRRHLMLPVLITETPLADKADLPTTPADDDATSQNQAKELKGL